LFPGGPEWVDFCPVNGESGLGYTTGMRGKSGLRMSLARKISLLFGSAVLVTIAGTLVFPWIQMSALEEQSLLWRARRISAAAFAAADVRDPDWSRSQARLNERWRQLEHDLHLTIEERPRLVPLGSQGPGFQTDAVERLSINPGQQYYWTRQREGRRFRFAMAVRGINIDPHPDALRGIIDVSLPIPREAGVWNAAVTVLAGASGAVLAILVFYVVTQRLVLNPVTTLRRAAEHVTRGNLDVRAEIPGGDEFQELADTFNDMLAHIKAAQDEQRKINRSLDIRLGELAETNVALFESNRVKSEFLANVSHELRTPLASIIGFAELLRDAVGIPDVDPKRCVRYAENILTSGRSLLELINDLLDLTKIEAGRFELHLSEFSLAELCSDLLDFIRPLADKKNHRLEATLDKALPRCRSDSGRIKQILFNLLSNAVKFTPDGGAIFLTAESGGTDRVRLIVRDTGPGIPMEQHQSIFEKFHQLDSSQTREHAGTGLGLAITKELVHVLGGVIRLDSRPGEGATFIVELPIHAQAVVNRPLVRLV